MKLFPLTLMGLLMVVVAGCASREPARMVAMEARQADAQPVVSAGDLWRVRNGDPPSPAAEEISPRRVVYTAALQLRVANRRETMERVEALCTEYGGFLQQASLEAVTMRVPPDKFREIIAVLEELGEVTGRQVNAEDVTDRYYDAELRLDVAERSRERLMALLDRADEIEDILAVEQDLRRLTEEIEKIKGELRQLDNRIDWATITVRIQERVREQVDPWRSQNPPFPWMERVGIVHLLREIRNGKAGTGLWGPGFRLGVESRPVPEGFVVLNQDPRQVAAIDAVGYRLEAEAVRTPQVASLDFWSKALRTDLEERLGYGVDAVEDAVLERSGYAGKVLRAEAAHGGERWAYECWLIQKEGDKERLLVVQYARLLRDRDLHLEVIEEAVAGARFRTRLPLVP